MRHPGGDFFSRRRRFMAVSRYAANPRHLFLELNSEATDYFAVPDTQADDFQSSWHVLQLVLQAAEQKLTRHQILNSWPAEINEPLSEPRGTRSSNKTERAPC
jgi:hypothetical protein